MAAVERNRTRMWGVCYRLTGDRTRADDLAQEAAARAIERAHQLRGPDASPWLLRLTTRLCLDDLRRSKIETRINQLADPVLIDPIGKGPDAPDEALVLRDDLRYAIVVALQQLTPRQRAALVLREVCDLGLADVAQVLETTPNAAKAVLRRARTALASARVHLDLDLPADASVVERFAEAVAAGDLQGLAELLADDVWGVVDGGGVVRTATKPTFGARAVARQWANARRRFAGEVATQTRLINGEAAVVISLAASRVRIAIVHLETQCGLIKALRVNRDPASIARLHPPGIVPA